MLFLMQYIINCMQGFHTAGWEMMISTHVRQGVVIHLSMKYECTKMQDAQLLTDLGHSCGKSEQTVRLIRTLSYGSV